VRYGGGMIVSWLRNRRRRRILAAPFPAEWQRILERRLRHYRHLPAEQKRRLHPIVQVLVAEKEWAGAGGLEITEDMKVTIAGEAAVMVSGFEPEYFFDRLHTLVIHPGTVRFSSRQTARNANLPEGAFDGIAWHRGPVVLSWARLRRELSGQSPGRNVILHEFAHHLDGLVGEMDGAPPLGDAKREQRWYAVTEAEFFRLVGNARRDEATLLDHYGASNRAEFFAVATECFFELPHELRERHRELYDTLADFYRQSPAEWLPRREAAENLQADANGQFVHVDRRERRRNDHARLRAVRDLPTADALFALGLEHLRVEQPEEAVRIFTRLIELDPQDEESLSQRAIALFQLERYDEAEADCAAALAIDPRDVDALCVRGEILLNEGDLAGALAALSAAVTEAPGDAEARVSRARVWLDMGRARKALGDLSEALKREPYLADAHYERGLANEALGRTREAEQDFRRAVLLEPEGDWSQG
jgi:Mlc titration factor MtfA (ptsG expression regulator)/Flp pilus assembly protein TadD